MKNKKLPMSYEDIVKEYREAKDKKAQVRILAELNDCEESVIIDILKLSGVKTQELPRKKTEKASAPQEAPSPKEEPVEAPVEPVEYDPDVLTAPEDDSEQKCNEIETLPIDIAQTEETNSNIKMETPSAAVPDIQNAGVHLVVNAGATVYLTVNMGAVYDGREKGARADAP